jgi:hypothetical protein
VNEALDDPIGSPLLPPPPSKNPNEVVGPGSAAWPFEVYVRLPRGFGVDPKDAQPYSDPRYFLVPCFRYGGGQAAQNVFVAAATVIDPKDKDKIREEPGRYFAANFSAYLRTSLEDFVLKTYSARTPLTQKDKARYKQVKAFATYPDAATPTLTYTHLQFTNEGNKLLKDPVDASIFDVFIYEDATKQVGIVFHSQASHGATGHEKSVEACLSTLDVSADASGKRNQFKRSR